MLIDDRFERIPLAQGSCIFGAQSVEAPLGLVLFMPFAGELCADVVNAGSERVHRLGNRFKLKSNLAALPAKVLYVYMGSGDFAFQAKHLPVKRSNVFFRLRDLVAHLRG